MSKYSDKAEAIKEVLDAAYGGNSPGTFTDLQNLINTNSANEILILDKDYKYDATTDSSLTSGITIRKNITINGNGHIIDGNDTRRAFYVNGNYILNLNNLIIQNGKATYGGAIYATSNSQVNITNFTLENNTATSGGGAIVVDNSQINITTSTLQNNTATGNGYGGAIYATSNSQVNITQSIIKNNTATNYANIYCNSATTVYNCEINDISTTCYNITNTPYLATTIVDNLTTNDATKVLSAKQGKALADLIGDAITYINM